jgi:hypothetical protein
MNLTNNEYIELKTNSEETLIYTFHGINEEIFDLLFDNKEKYFKIIRYTNDLLYNIKCENSYRTPDLKKLLIAYKYRNICDKSENTENIQNVFHYTNLKIVNISTTFECYYDQILKRDIYTKKPKYNTYLIEYNGYCTILSYNDKKYSTKPINISNNDCNYI